MTFSTPIPQKKNNININHKNAGRKVCIFLYPYRKESVFPLLSGKGLGLPAFCGKAALAGWLAGKNHPHSVPVFFPPSLALDKAKNRTGHVRNRNTALQGAGHVKFNPSRIMKRYQSWKGFPEYVPESGCAYTGREEQADRSIPPFGNNPVINATTL